MSVALEPLGTPERVDEIDGDEERHRTAENVIEGHIAPVSDQRRGGRAATTDLEMRPIRVGNRDGSTGKEIGFL